MEPDRAERLADTPTVKYIKERERDINSFRVISYSLQPHGRNFDLLDYPAISITRGLQSANGYDPIYLSMTSHTSVTSNHAVRFTIAFLRD